MDSTRPAASQPAARHCPSTQGHHHTYVTDSCWRCHLSCLSVCLLLLPQPEGHGGRHQGEEQDQHQGPRGAHQFVSNSCNRVTLAARRGSGSDTVLSTMCVVLRACRSVSRRPSPRARSRQVGDPQTACMHAQLTACLVLAPSDWEACARMNASMPARVTVCWLAA